MSFLSTRAPLARALADRNFTEPTPVQTAILADHAAGRDLLVSAQTGSGKTVAYGLAIAANVLGDADALEPAASPLALIIAPTRELALQVHRELAWLYAHAGARVVACVGGMDPRSEARLLEAGTHIVVGTPGRLKDHLRRRRLDVSALHAVVLDEADEMLDLGFREDLEFILKAMPVQRRTLMFSATLPKAIVELARNFQNDALRIAVSGSGRAHADIEYRAIRIAANEVENAVVNMLRFVEAPTSLVFCNTREKVRHLQAILLERGFSAVSLSGELGQSERNQALQALRDGRARVCVATDVAARGIDLPNLGLVIHAELPHDPEVLQHRSGRTGRAGRKGISVLLVTPAGRRRAEILLGAAGIRAIWAGPPTADDIRRLDHERMLQDAVLTEEPGEDDLAMARELLATRPAERIAAALVRLCRARLPAPEDVTDPGEHRPARERARGQTERSESMTRAERMVPVSAPHGQHPAQPRREPAGTGVWFRLNIGHRNKADPRWLLPLICRRGEVTKAEIGAIRIFDRETRFEVAASAADGFAAAVRRDGGEGRIDRLADEHETLATSPASREKSDRAKPWSPPLDSRRAGPAGERPHSRSTRGPPAKPFRKAKGKPGKARRGPQRHG